MHAPCAVLEILRAPRCGCRGVRAVPDAVAAALVSWDHSTPYPLPRGWLSSGGGGFTKTYKLGDEHAFIADHNVDGRILMPVRPLLADALDCAQKQLCLWCLCHAFSVLHFASLLHWRGMRAASMEDGGAAGMAQGLQAACLMQSTNRSKAGPPGWAVCAWQGSKAILCG